LLGHRLSRTPPRNASGVVSELKLRVSQLARDLVEELEQAKEHMIKGNLRLVVSAYQNRGLELDLVQEGTLWSGRLKI